MKNVRFFSLVALMLFAAFSGCSTYGPSAPPPSSVTGFQARFVADNRTIDVELSGPIRIKDAFLTPKNAYLLDITDTAHPVELEERYYLARDFRIIRMDEPCLQRIQGACRYAHAEWAVRGLLAPLGVGLPAFATDRG